MKQFNFSDRDKFIFYLFYFYYFLRIPLDLKSKRLNLLLTESVWVASKILKFKPFLIKSLAESKYETVFGKFNITPDLISTIAVSPSFERRELDILLKLIAKDVKDKKKILFIDVGAFFGLYTVAVGNRFKKYKNLDIFSFEPGTKYLSLPTNALLKKNVKENHLKSVRIFNFGLGISDSPKENLRGIKTKKLDFIINKDRIKKYDSIFMKIDVDGDEEKVLRGATKFIESANKIVFLVEDFVDLKILKYLGKNFKFMQKPSAYNSFWSKK